MQSQEWIRRTLLWGSKSVGRKWAPYGFFKNSEPQLKHGAFMTWPGGAPTNDDMSVKWLNLHVIVRPSSEMFPGGACVSITHSDKVRS